MLLFQEVQLNELPIAKCQMPNAIPTRCQIAVNGNGNGSDGSKINGSLLIQQIKEIPHKVKRQQNCRDVPPRLLASFQIHGALLTFSKQILLV